MNEEIFDIRWTCSNCKKITYSNKGYSLRQCDCLNMSPYMKKEYTAKGKKGLKNGQV